MPARRPTTQHDDNQLTVPVSEQQIVWLVELLKKSPAPQEVLAKRRSARFQIGPVTVPSVVEHLAGSESRHFVGVFDISKSGVGVVHRGYLHVGSQIRLWLPDQTNEAIAIEGKIRWCRYLRDTYHASGVEFTEPIDVQRFLDPGLWLTEIQNAESEDEHTLDAKVILREDDALIGMLVTEALAAVGLDVVAAPERGALFDAIKREPFDCLVMSVSEEHESDAAVFSDLDAIRAEGFRGAVLLLVPRLSDTLLAQASGHGVGQVIEKPFRVEMLLAVIRKLVSENSEELGGSQPLRPDPSCGLGDDAIASYIEAVRSRIDEILTFVARDQFDSVRRAIGGLHSTGEGFGFGVLSTAAQQAITQLDATSSLDESAAVIRRLAHVASRMTVGREPGPS